jgi:hypothetical protein
MGYFETAKKAYEAITSAEESSGITLTEEQRSKLFEVVMSEVLQSFKTEKELRRMIEQAPKKDLSAPRPMRVFSSRERAERRALSEAMRGELLAFYTNWSKREQPYKDNLNREYDREDQQMFYMPLAYYKRKLTREEHKQFHDHNDEVARLFDLNPANLARFQEGLIRELTTTGLVQPDGSHKVLTPEEAKAEADRRYARRRAEMVIERVQRASEMLPELERMAADPQALLQNARELMDVTQVYAEINNWLSDNNLGLDANGNRIKPARIAFTPEEIQWLRQQEINQTATLILSHKLRLIANPLYEVMDTDAINDYDYNVFAAEDGINPQSYSYQAEVDDHAAQKIAASQEKAFAKLINDDPKDKLSNLLKSGRLDLSNGFADFASQMFSDVSSMQQAQGMLAKDRLKMVRTDFCFDGENLKCYREKVDENGAPDMVINFRPNGLGDEAPIAFEKNGRVVVLCVDPRSPAVDPTSHTRPETLFNYRLEGNLRALSKRLGDADPWYWGGSPQFTAIRTALGKFKDRPLTLNSESDLKDTHRRLQELSTAVKTYIEGKDPNFLGKNDYEQERIDAALSVETYVQLKLKQLDLVGKARATAARFEGMSSERIQKLCRADDLAVSHQSKPYTWLSGKYQEYEARSAKDGERPLPDVLLRQMNELMMDLHMLEANHAVYNRGQLSQDTVNQKFAQVCGAMVAAELIYRERANLGRPEAGPMERLFQGENAKERISSLGRTAMTVLATCPMEKFDRTELKTFLGRFEPQETANMLAPWFAHEHGLDFMDKVVEQYPRRGDGPEAAETPLQRFHREAVQDAALGFAEQMADGVKTADPAKVRRFLSSCVIANMVKLENMDKESGYVGKLEQSLANPIQTQQLRAMVEKSGFFDDMMKDQVIRGRKEIDIQTVVTLVERNVPQTVANSILVASLGKQLANPGADKAAQPVGPQVQQGARQVQQGAAPQGNEQPQVKNPNQQPPAAGKGGPVIL